MLTPKQIDDYPARLVELYNQTECDIIADMAKRMAAKDMFIPSSQWQMDKLLEMGAVQSDVEKRLAKVLGKTQSEVHKIIVDSGYKALKKDAAIYEKAGIDTSQALQSDAVKQALENGITQTLGTFRNITRTTANNATMQYYDALDGAYLQVSSGAFDYTTAITNAIKKISDNGIACATYASGHKDYLDVAVRRATLTGLNQAALHAQVQLADELGNDLVEVTAHSGARTGVGVANHARWQGRVYSLSGTSDEYPSLVLETGYGTGAGLGGWNCRHSFFPYIEGASETVYTDYELAELNAPKYEYNGERLTEYEATQKQRYIERQIRKYKREVAGLDAAGIDSTDSRNRLAKWQQRQRDFIEQTGLKRDYSREQIEKSSKTVDTVSKMDYNYKKDKEQFEKYRAIFGDIFPKDFEEFQALKYFNTEVWNDFKAQARTKNYLQEQLAYVWNGEKLFIPKYVKFESVVTIAGYGTDIPIRVIDRLVNTYGGKASDWRKRAGKITSDKYVFDIHWYELDGIQYNTKLKHRKKRIKKE